MICKTITLKQLIYVLFFLQYFYFFIGGVGGNRVPSRCLCNRVKILRENAMEPLLKKLHQESLNSLSANPTKWSNTLKQFVGKLPTNCLSVFDHFGKLVLKELSYQSNRWIDELLDIWIFYGSQASVDTCYTIRNMAQDTVYN